LKKSPGTVSRAFGHLNAHWRLAAAGVAGVLALAVMHGHPLATQLVLAWDTFAFVMITLAFLVMVAEDPYEVRRHAEAQDASGTFLFVAVVLAAMASLFAVFLLLGPAKGLSKPALTLHVVLSVTAIVLSWMLAHTLFALRYAHAYYVDAHKLKRTEIQGGLMFPGKEEPDYLDFAYFSFVIGMTCQVSDVQIASKRLRRLAMVHGLIAFMFNTAILATFVNIVAGLV
jgi:uncharacterized membrane protein